MKYINLPKPHGFLIWRGKQTAIASPLPLLADEKMLLVSNNEAYGELTLSQPTACNLSEFERLESEHRIRPEDRKLYWPDASVFYVHRLRDWQPYEEYIEERHKDSSGRECSTKRVLPKIPIRLNGDSVEFVDLPEPTQAQKNLIEQAERLPKTIILSDAISLEGTKRIIQDGIDHSKIEPILNATLEATDLGDATLDLYQLALVRVPRLLLKKKEVTTMEDKSIKELLAEARKCYDEGMAMPVMYGGPVTFADLEALEEAREVADEAQELAYQFQMLSSNVLSNPEITDKGQALAGLATEYGNRVQQVGKKELEEVPLAESIATEVDDKAGKRVKTSMKEKLNQLWDTFKEFMDWANEADKDELPGFSKGFGIAVKQVNGEPWHFAWSTNAFQDREGEIFSTKSLEKYVEEAEQKGDMGHFNFWHIGTKNNPGLSDFAEIKWQGVIGRFLVEAGPYLKDEKGQSAKLFFEQYPDGHPEIAPEGWGSSPEYRYLPEERLTGVYENIWKTRTSTLPRLAAANIITKAGVEMALSEQQKAAAVKIFGEDLTAKIVGQAEAATKDLEEAGVAHKEVTETVETKTEVNVPLDELAQAVVKQLDLNFQPFSDALALIGQELAELKGEVKSLEKQKALESKVETSRYVFSLQQASKAAETIVPEGDPLKDKKPVETRPIQDKSGAANFFPAR